MRLALIGVLETDCETVPLFRVTDPDAIRAASRCALDAAEKHRAAFDGRDGALAELASAEVDLARAALDLSEPRPAR